MRSALTMAATLATAPPWWLPYATGALVAIAGFTLWMIALDDAVRRPEWEYPRLLPFPSQRTAWLAIVLLGNLAGSAVYYAMVMRPNPRQR